MLLSLVGTHGNSRRTPTCRRSAASHQSLFMDLGTAVHFQHLLLSHRLLSFAWISEMDFDHHLHAHGLGAPGTEICHPRPDAGLADSDWAYGGGRGLHLLDAVGGILAVSETQL